MEQHHRSLATAHAALMFLSLIALAILAYTWPAQETKSTAGLATPALCLQTAVLLYLASTAMLELNFAQGLRRGQSVAAGLGMPTLLGHLWIFLVAAFAAWRGAASRTYLARLDWQLATLLTISLLSLALLFATQRVTGGANDPANTRQLRGLSWLHAVLCMAAILALWWLETRPL